MQLRSCLFVIKYVSDQYENKGMCNKVTLEIVGTIRFIPDYCKDPKTCKKVLIAILMY